VRSKDCLRLVSAAWLAALALATPAAAATIPVNTTTDEVTPSDGLCSLREAADSADFNSSTDCTPGDVSSLDTIQLAAAEYDLSSTFGGITLQNPSDTGGIEIVGLGMGATTISGGGTLGAGIFATQTPSALTLQDLTLDQGGGASVFGGGVSAIKNSLTLTRTAITNNTGAFGAGVYYGPDLGVFPAAVLTITDSVIDGNTASPGAFASASGAGIITQGPTVITGTSITNNAVTAPAMNNSGDGGGIHADSAAEMTLTGDLIAGNSVEANHNADGGGIATSGPLTAVNDTFTDNSISGGNTVKGGALEYQGFASPAALTNVTFAGDSAPTSAAIDAFEQVDLLTSILDDGSGACGTEITTLGGNIDHGASCWSGGSIGDLQNTNPMLGTLADNTGPTETMSLLTGSPAIDHVPVAACVDQQMTPQPVTTDQRGISRPQGSACDSGAFELEQASPPPPGGGGGATAPGATGQRAAALKKCKKKFRHNKAKRKKCRKRAKLLPV
jgi:CSLREA domain-containing protein